MKFKNIYLIVILLLIILGTFRYVIANRVPDRCLVSTAPVKEAIQCSPNCYILLYKKLMPYFLVYNAKVNSKPLEFIRLGHSTTIYVLPKYALEQSDALIGYGINDDILLEDQFADMYNKNSYGYDCGVKQIATKNKKCIFKSECIGTDKYLLTLIGQKSSKKIHSFGQNLSKLGLNKKRVFVKMDIAGAEQEVMDDVLKYSDNITGLALVIHCDTVNQILPTIRMLKEINKNFVLVERHTHITHALYNIKFKCSEGKGYFSSAMSLTFINKNLIDDYKLAMNQDSSKQRWEGHHGGEVNSDIIIWKVFPFIIGNAVQNFINYDLPKFFNVNKNKTTSLNNTILV